MARDQAHRRADDGEPLVRQPARDGAPPGPGRRVGRRADASGTGRSSTPTATPPGTRSSRTHASSPCQLSGEPSQAGTPATSPRTTAGTTASSRPASRSRCATGTSTTSRSRTRWPSTSRSASGTSARCSGRPIPNRRFLFSGTASGTIERHDRAPRRRRTARSGTGSTPTTSTGAIYYRASELPELRARAGHRHAGAGGHPRAHVRPVPLRRRRRQAAAVHVPRPELRHDLGGEPAGHPARRAVHRPGRAAR